MKRLLDAAAFPCVMCGCAVLVLHNVSMAGYLIWGAVALVMTAIRYVMTPVPAI